MFLNSMETSSKFLSLVRFIQFSSSNQWFLCISRLTMYGLAEFQIEGDGNCQVCLKKIYLLVSYTLLPLSEKENHMFAS